MKKQVRFSLEESVCEYEYEYGCSSLGSIAPENVWYQAWEYDQIRRDALSSVQEARTRGINALIKQNYGCTDSETQEKLNLWAKRKNTNRGMERFVCEEYGRKRLHHRRKVIDAVIYTQQKLWKENRNDGSAAVIIRTVSSTLSGNAIEFARMLANADRVAVESREKAVRVRMNQSSSRPARPPTGKSPISAGKHQRDSTRGSHLPPRHPGPVRYNIHVSPSA
jgi:hypothetical protein